MFNKYTPEQVAQKWRELANLTEFKTAMNEGGNLLTIVTAPNKVTYAIIKENANYFIKHSKELKESYVVSDFKYLGNLNKTLEKHSSYSMAKKRMEGLVAQIKEDFKREQLIKEMQDDDQLLADFDKIDSPEGAGSKIPVDTGAPTGTVPTDEIPNTEIPQGDSSTEPVVSDVPPAASQDTPPPAEGGEQPLNDVPPSDTTTPEPDLEPTGDSKSADDNSEGHGDMTDIQSLLGKLQNQVQQLDTLTPSQTKNILNTVISSTKDGISGLDDDEKQDIAKRIERNGDKVNETNNQLAQSWEKDSISSFLGEIGQERFSFASDDSGSSQGDFGNVNFDTNGEVLYLHFSSPEDASIAITDFKNNANGIADFNQQGNTVEVMMTLDETASVEEISGGELPSDSAPVEDETPSEELSGIDSPSEIGMGDKVALLQSMIKAKLELKKKDSTEIVDIPKEEDPLGIVKDLVNESIKDLKKDKVKNFIQESIEKNALKKNIIKESIIKSIEEGLTAIHEDQYSDAVALAQQFVQNPDQVQEGVVSDNFKRIAKPFVIAAFLSVLGGKVDAAVDNFKKATGQEPSQSEISQGIKTYEQKSGNKIDGPGSNENPEDSSKPQGTSLIGQDLGSYDQPGAFALDTNKIKLGAKLVDFKKVNVDQAVAKYSDGQGDGHSEFKELRGPRMINKEVVKKPFDQLDDSKDSERLEKIWRIIGQNPEQVIQDGVVKNENGSILANNVERKPDGKIVFDFTFVNPDSKDYKDGKTPQKMLGGELIKTPDAGGEQEVNMVWAKLRKPGAYDLGKITDPNKFNTMKAEVEKRGFKNQPGTNYWIQGEKSFWVDADKAKELYKQGLISFNNPNVEKTYRTQQ